MPGDILTMLRDVLPASPSEGELRRAAASALSCYLMLRSRLAEGCAMPLNEQLGAEVLPILRSAIPSTEPSCDQRIADTRDLVPFVELTMVVPDLGRAH
jgi:hypothetical protein